MTTGFLKILILTTILISFSNFTFALSGKEISAQVSNWLSSRDISGQPIFSSNRIYKDCAQKLQIRKYLNSFKTVKVYCPNNDDIDLFIRVKIDKKEEVKQKFKKSKNKNKLKYKIILSEEENKVTNKRKTSPPKKKIKNKVKLSKKENKIKKKFKVFKIRRGLEKNSVLQDDDINVVFSSKSSQTSFFKSKNELIGRKLNKNLKMDQILHPRHLNTKFDVNNGDQVSIVSNTRTIAVTVLGEALGSGNLDDLIRVKNVRSGKVIKGYIKKNKIIRVFR